MENALNGVQDILSSIGEWLLELFTDWFGGNTFYSFGINLWNWGVGLISAVATTSPEDFSSEAWSFTTGTALDFSMTIGASLLNIFYLVGIIRQSTNLKDNFTLEIFVENVSKMLIGNMLILNGVDYIRIIFSIAGISANYFLIDELPSFEIVDIDAGSFIFNFFFGLIFMVVCVVCAFTIFTTLYSRYLYIYLLIATYPLAYSTLPGGPGVHNTASSWTRAFIGKSLEVVIIALSVSIAGAMCGTIDFGSIEEGLGTFFDGALQAMQSVATMVILTASVKGADSFVRRTFGL